MKTHAVIQTEYFDADAIAMRTEFPEPAKKPLFNDSKGFFVPTTKLKEPMRNRNCCLQVGWGFMTAGMIPQAYKLPPEPYLDAYQKLEEKDINLNFLVLEMAFIYKPGDFEDDSYYIPSKTKCNNSENCTKFSYMIEYPRITYS